jgi:hypothetical protein
VYVSFCGVEWETLGRMTETREEAEDEDVPGDVCSVSIVVP